MFEDTKAILRQAEAAAGTLDGALEVLRRLPFDDFARVMFSMPMGDFPTLSKVLPRMAPERVQLNFTGATGERLLHEASAFVWTVRARYAELSGRSLANARMLDFGCGYGRFVRLMYYFTDPDRIHAFDAWEGSIGYAKADGVRAEFATTKAVPLELPLADASLDLAYSFSVFTHISEEAALAAFSSIGRALKPRGLLFATFRTPEVWVSSVRNFSAELRQANREKQGVAFAPLSDADPHYGVASMTIEFLESVKGLRLVGIERSVVDQQQPIAILQKA